jgi:hypothetical protein
MQGNRRGAARRAVRAALALTVATALVVTGSALAQAATTNPNPGSLELRNAALSKRAATEGMVLLENNDHALPMPKTGNVAVYGVGAYKTVKGGTGSGDVNNRYLVTVRQGLENAGYAVTTGDVYWQAMTAAYDAKYGTPTGGIFGPAIDYSSVEQTLTPSTVQPKAATDTAIYVLARNSGEGTDRKPGAGDYELTDVERADIQIIGQTYRKVVVLLNVGGIVDTSFFEEINAAANDPSGERPLDAMLLMSQGGQESGNAVTEVLNGTVTPSGKLTDTWASQYSYYPAAATFGANDGDPLLEQYTEGVYVGYRYFDSKYRTLNADDPEWSSTRSDTACRTPTSRSRRRASPRPWTRSPSKRESPTSATTTAAATSCRYTCRRRSPASTSRTNSWPAMRRPIRSRPARRRLSLSLSTPSTSPRTTRRRPRTASKRANTWCASATRRATLGSRRSSRSRRTP